MRVSVKSGHMTARAKQVAKQMIENGWGWAKSGIVEYEMTLSDGVYTVEDSRPQRDSANKMVTKTYKATYTVA